MTIMKNDFNESFSSTLGIQINIHRTFINFWYFSQHYGLIWDRMFIRFESIRFWPKFAVNTFKQKVLFTKILQHVCMLIWIRTFNITSSKFSNLYSYLDPYVYCFCQNFQPVCLFGPVRLFGPLEQFSFLKLIRLRGYFTLRIDSELWKCPIFVSSFQNLSDSWQKKLYGVDQCWKGVL